MEIPRHWRLKRQRYGLVGEVCPHCDYKIFPPQKVCPNCGDLVGRVLEVVANPKSTEDQVNRVAAVALVVSE